MASPQAAPQSKMSSNTQSLLLALPAELRFMIYEDVFRGVHMSQKPVKNGMFARKLVSPPGLLLVCKAIHYEATKCFYATASFHFDIGRYAALWMQSIPREYLVRVSSITYHKAVAVWVSAESWRIIEQEQKWWLLGEASWDGVVLEDDVVEVERLWLEEGVWEACRDAGLSRSF